MTVQFVVAGALGGTGTLLLAIAVVNERLMQRHRQPGVTYRDVTLRRDGGWRRSDLFTPDGLHHQRRASAFGVSGAACLVLALISWILLR